MIFTDYSGLKARLGILAGKLVNNSKIDLIVVGEVKYGGDRWYMWTIESGDESEKKLQDVDFVCLEGIWHKVRGTAKITENNELKCWLCREAYEDEIEDIEKKFGEGHCE